MELPGAALTLASRFVVFEGGEGSGKSTQCALLADHLRAAGQQVVVTRETADRVGDRFECVDIGVRQLAGREAPIEILEVRT